MNVVETVAEMELLRGQMAGRVAMVPTMGYLHEGHLSLIRRARTEADHVVVSIFVNPTQFRPGEDFDRYPRDPDRDLRLLGGEGVDAIFMPSVSEMYPPGFAEWVDLKGPLVDRLEGASRPGHFRGVTTVVVRLFRILQPHRAYFGLKDGQQIRVIRRMVRDLALPVEIVPCVTQRDLDGLALSSRNTYLSPTEREAASVLWRALCRAQELFRAGERDAEALRTAISQVLAQEPLAEIDFVSVADSETLAELAIVARPALVSLAVRFGVTRLVDNILLLPPGATAPSGLA